MFKTVPGFRGIFQSFGADLPLMTLLSMQFYPALLALPLLVLVTWIAWPRREQRGLAALGTGAAIVVVCRGQWRPCCSLP